MIAAEAFTYSISGCLLGCFLGLGLSYLLYQTLIASHFNYAHWSLPIIPLLMIVVFIIGSTVMSFYSPSRRIRKMSITDTISSL